MQTRKYKRIIQLELNEISRSVIDTLISDGRLPNFKKINEEWSFHTTCSEQEYIHHEPWIQWVTVHTGKSLAEHHIFRLSDAPNLKCKQIFETLSEHGIESAVVGSMNTIRGCTKGGFFLPDPWSKNNDAYPMHIQPLWNVISRLIQKRTEALSFTTDLTHAVHALKACLKLHIPLSFYGKAAFQLARQKINPLCKWKLPALFDVLLSEIFKRVLTTEEFGYYTLFMNSVAHYQHHYWRNFDRTGFDPGIAYNDCNSTDDPVTFGYQLYDRILGDILPLAKCNDTLIIIASGLSQVPFTEKDNEGGMNYYRLKNHRLFAHALGLTDVSIHPLMSRDWEIGSDDPVKLEQARKTISELTVDQERVFKVSYASGNLLFVETAVTKKVTVQSGIQGDNGHVYGNFHDFFVNTAIKSGHHTGVGNLWTSEKCFNDQDYPMNQVPLTALYPFTLHALL